MSRIRNLLAFDLGASNGRAILGQLDGERITMQELHRFENNYIEMNGIYYWDTPYLYDQLKQGLLAFNTLYQLYRRRVRCPDGGAVHRRYHRP